MSIYPKESSYILDEKRIRKGRPIKYIINNECWECVSHSLNNNGYSRLVINKKEHLIHRYVYEI